MKTTMNTGPGRFYRSRPKAMIAGLAGALVFAASLFTGGGKAQAAAPDAGSSVGNIATASYLDGGGTSRTANSLPVITTVEQVGSLTLTATQTLPASPGQPVTFVHNLVNTGNGTDSFNLVTAQLGTDDFNFTSIQIFLDADKNGVADGAAITSVDNLGRDADVNILVIATVPGSAVDGDQGQLTITATSQATGTATDTNTDTADVTGAANVTVSKTVVGADDGAPGDGPFTFRFTYENIGIGAAQTLTFTDTINAELEYVDDSGRWSVTGATVLTDNTGDTQGTAPNTIDYSITGSTITVVVNEVLPGDSGTIDFQVNIAAGATPGGKNNTVSYEYNDGTDDQGPFIAGPATVTVNETYGVTLTGDTQGPVTQGATVIFTNTLTNDGNVEDTFNLTYVRGNFPAGAQIDFMKLDGVTLQTDSTGDSIPDTGPVAAGATINVKVRVILPPGMTDADVPATLTKTATSTKDPGATPASDDADDTLDEITDNTVDVTNDLSVTGGADAGDGLGAGPEVAAITTNTVTPNRDNPVTTSFILFVNNTSTIPDAFDLAAGSTSGMAALPAGWSVKFFVGSAGGVGGTEDTETGSIAANGSVEVTAVVTVPAGATPTTQSVFFRALSPTTTASDIKHDAVTVQTVRSLTITPNNTGQIFPNGTVTYSHTLENTGNVAEGDGVLSTITLSTSNDTSGFSSVVHWDTDGDGELDAGEPNIVTLDGVAALVPSLPLQPGDTVKLIVKVFADNTVSAPGVNTTTITASTANNGHTTTAPTDATATDQSTIVEGNVQVTKKQALDANEDGAADGAGFVATPLTAPPGTIILYQIKVKNSGTTTATNVVVTDTIPTHTTYLKATLGMVDYEAAAAATVGTPVPTITTEPANGAADPAQLVVTIPALASLEEVTITFAVRINE